MKMWIARDKDGGLWLYDKKPRKNNDAFYCVTGGSSMPIYVASCSEVTFENSPMEVEIKLVKQ